MSISVKCKNLSVQSKLRRLGLPNRIVKELDSKLFYFKLEEKKRAEVAEWAIVSINHKPVLKVKGSGPGTSILKFSLFQF